MIYCVEDDNGIRDLMIYTLAVSGYEAKGFPDSTGLWEALHTVRPELIMLDIMLPGEDGINHPEKAARELRYRRYTRNNGDGKGDRV